MYIVCTQDDKGSINNKYIVLMEQVKKELLKKFKCHTCAKYKTVYHGQFSMYVCLTCLSKMVKKKPENNLTMKRFRSYQKAFDYCTSLKLVEAL